MSQKLQNTLKLIASIAISCISFQAIAKEAKTIIVAGSDLIAPIIQSKLENTASKQHINLKCDFSGSDEAAKMLESGKADIAIIGVPQGTKTLEGVKKFPLAFQAAIVIVNSANPLEEISTLQLKNIYSQNAESQIESWGQLNVKHAGLKNIVPIITNFSDNVVVELFKFGAMDNTNLASWVSIVEKKQDIFTRVKQNQSTIAVVGKLRDDSMIKALAIAKTKEGKTSYAYRPDRDSMLNNDYPLSLPFYIMFKSENAAKVKSIAQILLSDDIANAIEESDFYAAPKNSREKSIFDLDISK